MENRINRQLLKSRIAFNGDSITLLAKLTNQTRENLSAKVNGSRRLSETDIVFLVGRYGKDLF